MLILSLLACAHATGAMAQPRDYTLYWLPSSSNGVDGYELHVRDFQASSVAVFDLGLPPVLAGTMSRTVSLDGGANLIASLRAYGAAGVSPRSNEIVIWKRPAQSAPAPVVTRVDGLTGVLSGSVVVSAVVDGSAASVSFSIDGILYRIENAAPWSLQGDGGAPGTEQPFDTTMLSDGPHTLEVVAWSEEGASGVAGAPLSIAFEVDNEPASSPVGSVPPSPNPPGTPPAPELPPSSPDDAVVGLFTRGDAIHVLRMSGSTELLYRYHLIANYELRPTWCDLDGDADRDLVLGFGSGSLSMLMLLTLEDMQVVDIRVLQGTQESYANTSGETFPSCGDVDGDGRNEVAIGRGAGSGVTMSMMDDVDNGYAFMPGSFRKRILTLPTDSPLGLSYLGHGAAKPVVADVDGDGYDEIVVARSEGGQGTVSILDDARTGYRMMLGLVASQGMIDVIRDDAYAFGDGSTEVTAGDIDGDGRAEIVVATRRAGLTGIDVYDDALAAFELIVESGVQTPRADGVDAPLELLVPMLADIDGDGRLEVALGHSAEPGAAARVQILDDLETQFAPFVWTGDAEGMVEAPLDVDAIWPAIEANP